MDRGATDRTAQPHECGEKVGHVFVADASRDGPLHRQISVAIETAIAAGELAPGERLPSERELAARFGVNRLTLRQALAALERRRLIRRAVGRRGGTFISEPRFERDLTSFAGFSEQARRHGVIASAVVLEAKRMTATDAVARALEIETAAPVFRIERLRLAAGQAAARESSSFPAERFPGLLDEPLEGSLYELLTRRFGIRPCHGRENLEPISADREMARLLDVPSGAPLLRVERVAFDEAGVPVEHARDVFRADRTRFVVWSFELPQH